MCILSLLFDRITCIMFFINFSFENIGQRGKIFDSSWPDKINVVVQKANNDRPFPFLGQTKVEGIMNFPMNFVA